LTILEKETTKKVQLSHIEFPSYQQLFITSVQIRFISTGKKIFQMHASVVYLIYQVSDKRLLPRCGTNEDFLSDVRRGSSDLRICAPQEPKS